ncbi:MAG: nitroreductase family protein [Thermodesulfobacteriota bacterium]
MTNTIGVLIDSIRCSGCGRCLRVCPDRVFSLLEGRAVVSGRSCIGCGHCVAVCPEEAIVVSGVEPDLGFTTFTENRAWLPWGESDVAELVRLMRSRRSCRNYQTRPIPREMLRDLVKIGTTAPSGTNSQAWTFTVLAARVEVEELGNRVADFYRQLNRRAKNPLLRLLARFFMKDALGRYYRSYYQSIADGLRLWEEEGRDLLFHGATAALVVGSRPGGSCPAEDALLATGNILLAAHAMGLGTCLIGFAVEAMRRERFIPRALGMTADETIHAVIALGWPAETYREVTGRRPPVCRFLSPVT